MEITFIGHSSFRIRGKSVSVVTDPYDPKMVGLKYAKVDADIVTISHNHEDHNKSELVTGVRKVISGPGEYEISGISIIGIPSFHDTQKGSQRGKNTIYVIEMDRLTMAHLGDLGHTLDDKIIDDMGEVDILFIPVGGVYTIGPGEAAEVVQQIEPKIIIPMHYRVEGLNPEVFSDLSGVEEFLGKIGNKGERLPKLQIKKEEMSEEQRVVILERK
ncbi:MBL fold metallo-hydrolase [Candidatus Woesebacteria bacterium]|nr:MBL fold metallo-hydrolase [Candidatus Woesebacteria bacterium]